jgi:hypothetical protein
MNIFNFINLITLYSIPAPSRRMGGLSEFMTLNLKEHFFFLMLNLKEHLWPYINYIYIIAAEQKKITSIIAICTLVPWSSMIRPGIE